MPNKRIYESSNGDTWDLVKDGDRVVVLHTPNPPSGGVSKTHDLANFMSIERHSPQYRALMRMIGTLVDEPLESAST